ncbi:MAG: beta-lactamase family protein [Cyclobacteriaceae bacterium]
MKYFTLSFVILVLANCSQKAPLEEIKEVVISQEKIEQINAFVESTVNNHQIPGLSYAFSDSKSVIENSYLSQSDLTSKSSQKYSALDLSELLVATAILKLKEEGALRLSEPIVKHVPYFRLRDTTDMFENITIQQLLTHTSGMPIVPDNLTINPDHEDALEITTRSIRDLLPEYVPGSTYKKNFMDYDILGDIIHKVSGYCFEEYMGDFVLNPSGMDASTYLLAMLDSTELFTPYFLQDIADTALTELDYYPFNKEYMGSKGLLTSTGDLVRWANMILNGGKVNGKPFLTKENVHYLLKAFHKIGPNQYLGLSWEIEGERGNYIYSKSVSDHGFSNVLVVYPKYGVSVAIMTNSQSSLDVNQIAASILGFLTGQTNEIAPIPVSPAGLLVQTYLQDGVDEALEEYNSMKLQDSIPYDLSMDGLIQLINYILANASLENKESSKNDVLTILDYCDAAFPQSPRVALSYADSYLIFDDTVQVNNYLAKAMKWSDNAPEVAELTREIQASMRDTLSVQQFSF